MRKIYRITCNEESIVYTRQQEVVEAVKELLPFLEERETIEIEIEE